MGHHTYTLNPQPSTLTSQIHIYTHTFYRVCVCVCVCVYARICVHIYMRMYVYVCIYLYLCMCAYTYICVHLKALRCTHIHVPYICIYHTIYYSPTADRLVQKNIYIYIHYICIYHIHTIYIPHTTTVWAKSLRKNKPGPASVLERPRACCPVPPRLLSKVSLLLAYQLVPTAWTPAEGEGLSEKGWGLERERGRVGRGRGDTR